jgi:hypothetical protein
MFGMKSTGSMAWMVLKIEVYHYSTSKLCLNRTSEDADDHDDAALDTEELESKIRKYLVDTDLHANQNGIIIYFAGNPPLTVSLEHLHQSTLIDIPAQDSIELFHDCAVMDPNLDNFFASLGPFFTNGPLSRPIHPQFPNIPTFTDNPPSITRHPLSTAPSGQNSKKDFADYRRIRKASTEFT